MSYVDDVLAFWFDTLKPEHHFRPSPDVDEAIRSRFLGLYEELAAGPDPEIALAGPDGALATIIALDQFPRNMFRGTARAFAADPVALHLAKQAVWRGLDQGLETLRRKFMYLPYEHSETLADQWASVHLMSAMRDAELTKYALAHQIIIERFGRFPHRNAALGRQSTAEEIEFLKQPNSSF